MCGHWADRLTCVCVTLRLKNTGRIWELIKKSPFLSDYSRTLNKMGLYQKT